MKRIISCIIAIVMLLGLNTISFAESDSVVTFDKISGKLTVEDSNVANAQEGDAVTMIILKPGYTFEALEEGTITLSESAYAIKQTKIVKEYNKLSYSFGDWTLPASTKVGTYFVRVGINSSYVKEGSFYFITLDILKSRINEIDKAEASGIESKLKENKDLFEFDLTDYLTLSSKDYVNNKMAGEDFSLVEDANAEELDVVVNKIKDKMKEYVSVAKLQEATGNIKEEFNKIAELYNIDMSKDSEYGKLSETLQNRVMERISDETFEDASVIEKKLNMHCALVKFESAGYGEVANLLKAQGNLLSLDLTKYSELSESEKTFVHKKLVENSPVYKTTQELQGALDNAVSDASVGANAAGTSQSSGSGGGGSKGSGGGKTISLPYNMSFDNNINKEETPASKGYFTDINSVSWAIESVNNLYEKGIVSGKAQGIFAPNDNVKRAEFIKMLTEALLNVDETAETSFVDVSTDSWYYKYAATCERAGLITGYEDGSLKPESNISRQEMAVMVKRFLNYRGVSLNSGNVGDFADNISIAEYAKEAAGELLASGIMSGDENKNFMPTANTTRAQAAKVIYEALKLCK